MKATTVLLLTLAILSSILVSFRDHIEGLVGALFSAAAGDPVPVKVVGVEDYLVTVPAEGELAGLKSTPVNTPQIERGPLRIVWLIAEGEIVKPGDLIVLFDDSDAQLSLQQSESDFSIFAQRIHQTEVDTGGEIEVLKMDAHGAELELAYANNQIRKDEEIFSRWDIELSVMSAALATYKKESINEKQSLQQHLAETDLKILNVDRGKAQTEIDLANQTLSSLAVTAAEAGVVIHQRWGFVKLEPGSEVWPGQPLADVASLNQFLAKLQVSENDVAGVEAGKPVHIWLNAFPKIPLQGKIQQVARVAQQVHRENPRKYFECDVLLDVPLEMMEKMKPGMKLRAEIEISRYEEALVLPKSAVIEKETEFFVFTQEGADYEEHKIKILAADYGFFVVEGIKDGTVVCLQHPYEKLKLHLPDFNAPAAPTQERRFVFF